MAHGIYRLHGVVIPDPAIAELHRWLLWTIGRKGSVPRGALAYETALAVFDLSDLIIHFVHISVPRVFRVSVIPPGIVLHHEDRDDTELTERDGLRTVRPLTTIVDHLREGRVSREHIERGFKDGIASGVITRADVQRYDFKPEEHRLIHGWLRGLT